MAIRGSQAAQDGIGSPFEDVARDAYGAWNAAVLAYLVVTANVHQHGAGGLGCECLLRTQASESGARVSQKIFDRATAAVSLVRGHGWATTVAVSGTGLVGPVQRVAATTRPLAAVRMATAPIAASAETRSVRMPAASAPIAKPKSRQKR